MVQPWLQHRKMKEVALGSLENLFAAEQVSHVPYDKGFEAAEWEPFCVLHTSGSTGLPRPITVNQVSNALISYTKI
jgi:acyl-coenzyme A synthetase/AMP-(fatty) acid ligase